MYEIVPFEAARVNKRAMKGERKEKKDKKTKEWQKKGRVQRAPTIILWNYVADSCGRWLWM
jgi:hypothetical protein